MLRAIPTYLEAAKVMVFTGSGAWLSRYIKLRDILTIRQSIMKNIERTVILNCTLSLLVSGQWACNTSKFLDRKSERVLERRKDGNYARNEGVRLEHTDEAAGKVDSTQQFYQVRIFPLDSFSYSLSNGFNGRASSIEISGSGEQVSRITHNKKKLVVHKADSTLMSSSDFKNVKASKSKVMEKLAGKGFLITLVALVLPVFAYFKIKQKLTI